MLARINLDMIYRYSHNPSFNYFDIRCRDKAVYGISLNNKTSSHDKLSILVIIKYLYTIDRKAIFIFNWNYIFAQTVVFAKFTSHSYELWRIILACTLQAKNFDTKIFSKWSIWWKCCNNQLHILCPKATNMLKVHLLCFLSPKVIKNNIQERLC